jgi:signal transduction histidine kinase
VLYCTPFFIAAVFILIIAGFAFNRRQVRGGWHLAFVCLAAAVWAATEGMLYLGLSVRTNLLITYIQYLGIAPLPPLALLFVLITFGFEAWITPPRTAALLGIAGAIILMVWTDPVHHLVFTRTYAIHTGPFPMLGLEHGVTWWVIIGYHYTLLALLSLLLIRQMLTASGFHTAQAGVILVAVGIVWIVNAVYISGNSPVPNMDIGPLAFALVAVSMAWGFFRYKLLDITPIARSEIVSGLRDPIMVLDHKDRLVDINPAAARLFNIAPQVAIGQPARQVLAAYPQLLELPEEAKPHEACLTLEGQEHFFDLHISLLADRRGRIIGRLIVMHDTTQRICAAEALCATEKLQGVFEMAGAVCHELNQPLMAITGYAELIGMRLDKGDPLYADVKKLVKQVERLGKITKRLMTITKYETKEYLDRKIIDIERSSTTPKSRP